MKLLIFLPLCMIDISRGYVHEIDHSPTGLHTESISLQVFVWNDKNRIISNSSTNSGSIYYTMTQLLYICCQWLELSDWKVILLCQLSELIVKQYISLTSSHHSVQNGLELMHRYLHILTRTQEKIYKCLKKVAKGLYRILV